MTEEARRVVETARLFDLHNFNDGLFFLRMGFRNCQNEYYIL